MPTSHVTVGDLAEANFSWRLFFIMEDSHEQRLTMKLCVKMGEGATETHEMPQTAYAEGTLSCSSIFG